VVGEFVQRNQTGWNLQYTADEKYCARAVTNAVHFYESGNLKSVWNHLFQEGVTDFTLSPGKNHSVAIFVPGRRGLPAVVRLFTVPNFSAPVSQKIFFKGDKVQMNWNEQGTAVVILAQTDVDKTNKNYYGESTMFLLTTEGFDSRIPLGMLPVLRDAAVMTTTDVYAAQTRKGRSMMSHGRRAPRSSVWFTATCQPRQRYSTRKPKPRIALRWVRGIPLPSPLTADFCWWPDSEILLVRWTFMI
jgi:hypothetical protein